MNKIIFILTIALLLAACASDFTTVMPVPPERYQNLGPASGSACGAILLLSTSTNFIPAGLNSRIERAYADALKSVPGATALVNVTLEESWFWFILGTMRCVTITGEGIR